jgi:hypothetical protein
MVTVNPLATRSLAIEDEMMPFPNEEVTPPVTNMNFVFDMKRLIEVQNPGQKYAI